MDQATTLDIVCPTNLESSGVEVLAARVSSLFPCMQMVVWGIGQALVTETSGSRITRAPLNTIHQILEQRCNSAPLLVMGLPESTDISARLITQLKRRGDRAALLLERPGRVPTDVGPDVNIEGVRNLITLNGSYTNILRSRYPKSRVFKAGLALPKEFFGREDSVRENQLSFTGRPTDSKGFNDLLRWWSQSQIRTYGFRLKVNVVGPMSPEHSDAIDQLGIEASALKGIDERGRGAGEALACIFPARVDHLPQSLLECMAVRGLAVCTRIPGHSDVVRNAKNGFLVDKELRDLDAIIWSVRRNVRRCMRMRLAARCTAWRLHGPEPSHALWGKIFEMVLS